MYVVFEGRCFRGTLSRIITCDLVFIEFPDGALRLTSSPCRSSLIPVAATLSKIQTKRRRRMGQETPFEA